MGCCNGEWRIQFANLLSQFLKKVHVHLKTSIWYSIFLCVLLHDEALGADLCFISFIGFVCSRQSHWILSVGHKNSSCDILAFLQLTIMVCDKCANLYELLCRHSLLRTYPLHLSLSIYSHIASFVKMQVLS